MEAVGAGSVLQLVFPLKIWWLDWCGAWNRVSGVPGRHFWSGKGHVDL